MIGDCTHPNFDEGGVCTACKEFYSAEHDQNPTQRAANHPAIVDLVVKRGYLGSTPWGEIDDTP